MAKCKETNCTVKTALFNYKEEKTGMYCKKHSKQDMVDVIHKK